MSHFSEAFLTDEGIALLGTLESGGDLEFTRFAIGLGTWPGGDDPTMTELVDEKVSVDIQKATILGGGKADIIAILLHDDLLESGFYGKEIGVFVNDPVEGEILYCAAYAGDYGDWIPSDTDSAEYSQIFNMAVAIGGADSITIPVASGDAWLLATRLADHEAKELDPADTDTVKEKHLSNAQGKGWTDDITSVTDDFSTHEGKELDPADTDTVKEKHLSNAQGKAWQDHIGAEEPHDLFHLKNTIGIPLVREWQGESSAADNDWRSICWSPELRLFAAVAVTGTGNRVMTSSDGITWAITATGAPNNNWHGICWSPELSLFVAVAYSGTYRVMTSSNGTTWNNTVTGVPANNWFGVCWSPELSLFVAVAGSGTNRVMTSSNGTAWNNTVTGVSTNTWLSVCWSPEVDNGEGGNGLFVAVSIDSTGGNRVMTSHNGTTWTPRSAAEANSWYFVCWSPELSLFVAVAIDGTNRVMTSSDGITWDAQTGAVSASWRSVRWSPELSLFAAVAYSGEVMTSPNGEIWTFKTAAANQWRSVCWSPEESLFVAVGSTGGTGNQVMRSL